MSTDITSYWNPGSNPTPTWANDPSIWNRNVTLPAATGSGSGNLFEGLLNNVGSSLGSALPGLIAGAFQPKNNVMGMVAGVNGMNQGMSDISFANFQKLQPQLADFTGTINRKYNLQTALDQPFLNKITRVENAQNVEQKRLLEDLALYNNVMGDPNLGGFSQAAVQANPGLDLSTRSQADVILNGKQMRGSFRYLA